MARIKLEDDQLVVDLTGFEKVEAFHGTIRVPASCVHEVRWTDDPWSELRGMRAPGTGIPGVVAVGTRRGEGVKDFAAVHGKGNAVVVELEGAEYDRLIVTEDDAESASAELRSQLGLAG
jgi:hypothetical protein